MRLVATVLIAVLSGGCAAPGIEADLQRAGLAARRVELAEVPFHAQTEHHCGPAALATLLGHSGIEVTPEALSEQIYTPGLQGSLQAEVSAAARRHGRMAYAVPEDLEALLRELSAGRPVLVLQDVGLGLAPRWHYAVLIGFDRDAGTVTLRSGTQRRLVQTLASFEASWTRAGRWGLLLLAPGELPAQLDRQRYLRAVAPLARLGAWAEAEAGWRAALEFWPDELVALIGLANAQHARGASGAAIRTLERAVGAHPTAGAAHNNLAYLLGRAGAHARALEHAEQAVRLDAGQAPYRDTLEALREAGASAVRP